ncbi:hypothetical protein EGW08_014348, partial [Elysia chlorotica]
MQRDDNRYRKLYYLGFWRFVWCDTFKGMVVIQRRVDGSTSFNRSWSEYRDGFGDVSGDHWLGLETLAEMTGNSQYFLIVEPLTNPHSDILYSSIFSFRMSFRGTSSGSLSGAAFSRSNNTGFSTYDRDHDRWSNGSCAIANGGGWWYNDCDVWANLNGPWQSRSNGGIYW